jgi:3-oxoacyl-[acyl-carrier protein] reductase
MPDRKVVLITGTSRGLGKHLANHFLARGCAVVGCSRSADGGGIEHELYSHHVADVGSETDVVALFRAVREEHGRLDAAINNAAVNSSSLVAMTSAVAAAETLRANVVGPVLVCREAVKLMMRRKTGRIVNIGSMQTRHEPVGTALYTASKAALNALTRVVAKEVAAYGITCNVVAPATVAGGLADTVDPETLQKVLSRNAITETGTVEDVAATVGWLLEPEAAAVTGQIIYLGGA